MISSNFLSLEIIVWVSSYTENVLNWCSMGITLFLAVVGFLDDFLVAATLVKS